jgi:hypothetical protein
MTAATGYRKDREREGPMIRWVVVIFFALIVFTGLLPWLEKLGIGRLPGDLRFKLFGRVFSLPFASTILLSLAVLLLARFLK